MKRFILLILTFALVICTGACGQKKKEKAEAHIAPWDKEATEKMDAEWFYVPDKCTIDTTSNIGGELGVTFRGCGHEELNDYASDLLKAIKKAGFTPFELVFDPVAAKFTGIKEIEALDRFVKDDRFYGNAYTLLYHNGKKFYQLTIDYFGASGGKVANALCTVKISDATEDYKHYYEVLK